MHWKSLTSMTIKYENPWRYNRKVFEFQLDKDDLDAIASVQSKGKSLYDVLGDTGGEYRRRRRA